MPAGCRRPWVLVRFQQGRRGAGGRRRLHGGRARSRRGISRALGNARAPARGPLLVLRARGAACCWGRRRGGGPRVRSGAPGRPGRPLGWCVVSIQLRKSGGAGPGGTAAPAGAKSPGGAAALGTNGPGEKAGAAPAPRAAREPARRGPAAHACEQKFEPLPKPFESRHAARGGRAACRQGARPPRGPKSPAARQTAGARRQPDRRPLAAGAGGPGARGHINHPFSAAPHRPRPALPRAPVPSKTHRRAVRCGA